jgi:hypothetical protein
MAQQPEKMRSSEAFSRRFQVEDEGENCVCKTTRKASKVKDKSYEHCGNVFLTLESFVRLFVVVTKTREREDDEKKLLQQIIINLLIFFSSLPLA